MLSRGSNGRFGPGGHTAGRHAPRAAGRGLRHGRRPARSRASPAGRPSTHRARGERAVAARGALAALGRRPRRLLASPLRRGRCAGGVKERAADLPFIVVSGTVGEAELVEVMRAGAADYVLQGSLSRLAAAIRREVADAEARQVRREQSVGYVWFDSEPGRGTTFDICLPRVDAAEEPAAAPAAAPSLPRGAGTLLIVKTKPGSAPCSRSCSSRRDTPCWPPTIPRSRCAWPRRTPVRSTCW